jgi:ParB family chromosome partitioning protein
MSRASVANTIRLLDLEPDIKEALHRKQVTEGHARSLLSIRDRSKRQAALRRIITDKMSVRETEDLSRKMNRIEQLRVDFDNKTNLSIHEQRLIDEMRMKLGTKVSIIKDKKSNRIEIEYYSDEEFERIIDCLLCDQG